MAHPVHGNYTALVHQAFGRGTKFLDRIIVFLGDIVDRGPRSICCLILICILEICYPDKVFWIRGNHEFMRINTVYGLLDECLGAFGESGRIVHREMNLMMEHLPMCCILNDFFFLCHGGWAQALTSRQEIFRLVNNMKNKDPKDYTEGEKTTSGVNWSDIFMLFPKGCLDVVVVIESTRGAPGAILFNPAANTDFGIKCGIQMLIRGHQVRPYGFYLYPEFNGVQAMTVYSDPNSTELGREKSNNWASYIVFLPDNKLAVGHYINLRAHSPEADTANQEDVCDDTQFDEMKAKVEARNQRKKAEKEQSKHNN